MPRPRTFDADASLDAAMRTFWMHGYEATSMRNLVEATRMNRASLYATFGDKRELFLACLRHYDRDMRQARLRELEREASARSAIRKLFEGWIERAEHEPETGCFLTNTATELSARDEGIGALVAASQEQTQAFFRRVLEFGKARGELSASLDVEVTSSALLATLLGLLVLCRSRPERELLQAIADQAVAMLESSPG